MANDIKKLDAQEEKNIVATRSSIKTPDGGNEYDEDIDYEANERRVPISDLRKIRAEAAKYRKKLRQLESEVDDERKKAELSKMEETDKLRAIAEDAEARAKVLKERADVIAKQSAVINAASALGFYNPRDASAIVDLEQVEVDDNGTVDAEIVDEMVRLLAESKPYLIRGQQFDQEMSGFGPTNPPSVNWPKPKAKPQDRIEQLKQKSSELMRGGNMAAAIKLYNRAWEKERGINK